MNKIDNEISLEQIRMNKYICIKECNITTLQGVKNYKINDEIDADIREDILNFYIKANILQEKCIATEKISKNDNIELDKIETESTEIKEEKPKRKKTIKEE